MVQITRASIAVNFLLVVLVTRTPALLVPSRIAFCAPTPPSLSRLGFRTRKDLLQRPPRRGGSAAALSTCANDEDSERDKWKVVRHGAGVSKDAIEGDYSPRCSLSKPSQVASTSAAFMLAAAAAAAVLQPSAAVASGGRISGGYNPPERAPSAPSLQQQRRYQGPLQQYTPPTAGRDIHGTGDTRFHISFRGKEGSRRGNRVRVNSNAGDAKSDSMKSGDVVVIGGITAGIVGIQRYNRKRFLEDGGGYADGASTSPLATSATKTAVVTSIQVSMFCNRQAGKGTVLTALGDLSKTADVESPRGLSALVNEVCLTLLRAERDWIGATGSIKDYPPQARGDMNKKNTPRSRAKRDFNRAVTRERSKWERETVSNTRDGAFSSSSRNYNKPQGWRDLGATDGTYAVATLVITWAGLRSTPPTSKTRKGVRLWLEGSKREGGDRDVVFSVVNRESATTLLEWIGDEAAEGRGKNLLDVEVLWTPTDTDDVLDRDGLDAKWPELRGI